MDTPTPVSLQPVLLDGLRAPPALANATVYRHNFPKVTLILTVLFAAILAVPAVRANTHLVWTFAGLPVGLLIWQAILWAMVRTRGRTFDLEYVPVKSHYVQAAVQFSILLYWGWFAKDVYGQWPLILGQVVFLYILEALLTWSRGRTWRLGFGPLPIIFSTNLLLWFKPDWYVFQFLMVAVGALAKQFVTWERDGRRTHIFNPSAFGQFLFAVVLIATGTTNELTLGKQIAATFDTPHMLVALFIGGVIVQSLFHVTLMTLAAVAALCVLNLGYTQVTGTYFFVNTNLAAPIFLGMHLLITDPATSPKSNVGRIIFGAVYGAAYFVLFRVLVYYEVPSFWDKLLPVPFLNLCVPLIDRFARSGIVGRLNRWWEGTLPAGKLNLLHMGLWAGLFATMWFTGYVDGPHPGNSIPFWKKALADEKTFAGHSLVMAAGAQAEGGGSGAAFNELGLICMEGTVREVKQNNARAARFFGQACELGNVHGCANVAIQFLFLKERRSDADVARALDLLESECAREPDWGVCFLVGVAYENGKGRPVDKGRAAGLFERCGLDNLYAAKGLARVALSQGIAGHELSKVAMFLEASCGTGDGESCWYVAYMHQGGMGVSRDERRARSLLERACALGEPKACAAAKSAVLPPFSNPRMLVPGWSTAFPLP